MRSINPISTRPEQDLSNSMLPQMVSVSVGQVATRTACLSTRSPPATLRTQEPGLGFHSSVGAHGPTVPRCHTP